MGRTSRRVPLAAILALAGALMFAPAVAAHSGDRASGSGTRAPSCDEGCPAGTFSFDVFSGRQGQNARGWFVTEFSPYAGFTGRVTCLHTVGRWASIFGVISTGSGDADPYQFSADGSVPVYFVVVVEGRGKPRPGRPAPDRMSYVGWDTEEGWANDPGIPVEDICANPLDALGPDMFNLISGDIRVKNR